MISLWYGTRYLNSNQLNVTAGSIGILRYGTYRIDYFLNITSSVDTNYTVKILTSGIKGQAKVNTITAVNVHILFGLREDDEVTLNITTDQNTGLIFDGTTTAKLTVMKLD